MLKSIKIGKHNVGDGNPCYIIAEIGSNFDGSLAKAKKLIRLAKESGADAAKFQSFKTEKLLSEKGFEKKIAFQSRWKKPVWQVYKEAEFPRSWHKELNHYAKKIGIDFFTSPWDFEAVELLKKLNVPAIKVGSGDITYLEILKRIGKTKKPVLLATGASTMDEVAAAIKTIKSTGNKKIILMHSVTQYPSPIDEANVQVIKSLKKKFKLNVGYSDHSPGSLVVLTSIALGGSIIEKHFTLNSKAKGPDHPHSMDPKSFSKMVNDIRTIEKALGSGTKKIEKSEKETRILQRRGIWTVKNIKKNQRFTSENIQALRPVLGLSASKYQLIIGKKAKRSISEYEPIQKRDI
jgi:N-acetylneuraminate synthase